MITALVVHLTMRGINSAGYILCCQLPFDIIIDFSCQIFLDRLRCGRAVWNVWIIPRHRMYVGLSEIKSSDAVWGSEALWWLLLLTCPSPLQHHFHAAARIWDVGEPVLRAALHVTTR